MTLEIIKGLIRHGTTQTAEHFYKMFQRTNLDCIKYDIFLRDRSLGSVIIVKGYV